MSQITRSWLSFAAIGSGIVHLALVISSPLFFGIPLLALGLVELAWAVTVLVSGRLVMARAAQLGATTPLILWSLLVVVATALAGWPDLGPAALLPGMAVLGFGQGLAMSTLFRIVLSDVPAARAGVGSGVLVTTQQSSLALGVATLGTLFLALAQSAGMRTALVTALLVQVGGVAASVALSLRLPRAVR